jgi:hypothetical protein
MATAVYLLCALTSALCAALLYREYRSRPTRMLLWSSLAFAGLAVTNTLAVTDYVILTGAGWSTVRPALACAAILALIYGLVWDVED